MSPLFFALLSSSAIAGDLVELDLSSDSETKVVVRARVPGVFVPACRGVVWEVFDSSSKAYGPLPGPVCKDSGLLAVPEDGLEVLAPAELSPGTMVRPVVVLGLGCKEGLPAELADCESLVSVEGRQVTVRGK